MSKLFDKLRVLINQKNENDPVKIMQIALENIDNIAIAFSGAEDVVLIDMAKRINNNIQVFTLDTGRLHPETYRYIEEVRNRYNVKIENLIPDPSHLEPLIKEKGLFSFYKDGHKECCRIRKVEPLTKKLQKLDAWITGQRRDQSLETRSQLNVIEKDDHFGTDLRPLLKFNPLALWTSEQVWLYIKTNNVPYNELHSQGYKSIGCEPCTRRISPGQHEREGRWWWESETKKECGLHNAKININNIAS